MWNQRPRICLVAKFGAKIKIFKFETKNFWFAYFLTDIWKQYSHIWNQRPRICLFVKFREKMKITKFEPKLPNLRIFGLKFAQQNHPFIIASVPLAPFCLCLFFLFVFCISHSSIVFIISTLIIAIFHCLNYTLLLLHLVITHLIITMYIIAM